MDVLTLHALDGARRAEGLCVVIDVFRACTTACAIAYQRPRRYSLVADDETALRLRRETGAVLVGKPEIGSTLAYDLPNSPLRAEAAALNGRTVVHRTAAGAAGVMAAAAASEVILGAFVNAAAVVAYVRARRPALLSLVCAGSEGKAPTDEDTACAGYIASLLDGREPDIASLAGPLRRTSGAYFFNGHDEEYPPDDFDLCLSANRYDFVLRAHRHARHAALTLTPVDVRQ